MYIQDPKKKKMKYIFVNEYWVTNKFNTIKKVHNFY